MTERADDSEAKIATALPADVVETGVLFRGTVSRITFFNESTGFGVFRAESERSTGTPSWGLEQQITVVGVLPPRLANGSPILARGEWQTHPRFGRQFRAWSVTEVEPTSIDAVLRYLGSGTIKGFGPALAKRVVDTFGEATLDVLEREPDRLREVPGIGAKKLGEIKSAWEQKRNQREVMLFFQTYGIPGGLTNRIYNRYGERAIETVRNNPYVLTREVWGIGFQSADKIALALGLSPSAPERLVAGLNHTLKKASDDGHTFLPEEVLLARAGSLLQVEDEETLRSALSRGALSGEFMNIDGCVYPPQLYKAETTLAKIVAAMIRGEAAIPKTEIPSDLVETACLQPLSFPSSDAAGGVKTIRLSEEQQHAIRLAALKSLVVITGGPGCGKTTIIRTISSLFRRAGLQIKLAAPTGRAAQRLSEVCGVEASTIHRLLKFDPVHRTFIHDEKTPLVLQAIIIDESSMVDLSLAASLFQAIPKGARVIVVGDSDQLPSVGAGRFLADLLRVEAVPSVRLGILFRRADESSINFVAHQINAGEIPYIPEPDGKTKADAYFIPTDEPEKAAGMIENLVVDQIPKKFGYSPREITVLSPMNQGELGIISLNQRLQSRLVPPRGGLPTVKVGNLEFRLGDRVCQRVNNYNLSSAGVFNGDQGEVIGIDAEAGKLFVKLWDGRDVEYDSESLYQLDLAYAITVHRAQGSEVPVIVLVLHESHMILLERQLVYTAITRAKKLLIIVGTRKALALATKRSHGKRRYSALAERIKSILHQELT